MVAQWTVGHSISQLSKKWSMENRAHKSIIQVHQEYSLLPVQICPQAPWCSPVNIPSPKPLWTEERSLLMLRNRQGKAGSAQILRMLTHFVVHPHHLHE